MTANTSHKPYQTAFFSKPYQSSMDIKKASEEYDSFTRTRLSKHWILKEFLHCADNDYRAIPNIPNSQALVIKAGKALCENILEAITEQYGKPVISYGFQNLAGIRANLSPTANLKASAVSPHCWDFHSNADSILCRVDILPLCVEDGAVTKHEYGQFLMQCLDIDLLMTFKRSNVFCITYSNMRRRRVWVEWGRPSLGEVQREVIMGTDYWQRIYPNLPEHERPKFAPSDTGGTLRWSGKDE